MGKIIKLDKVLANQIAAGEVVERPFSVVKELIENSIDAGATKIKVEIKNGGIDEIVITDNGEGIEKEDLKIVTQKYTTSKIKTIKDLYNIMTFGFRGEALASISSVSKFQIISKIKKSDFAYSLEVIDGKESEIKEYPAENGTKIIVKDLFYNTPARLNYLKKPRTEYAYIADFLKQMSLSYPKIAIEFVSDGKTIFSFRENEDLKTRIYNIYGEDFFDNLLKIDFSMSGMNISGYISDPKISFGSNKKQALFVNNRIIKSSLIFKAIKDAYNRFIPHGQYPAYVLNLEIDPTQIDVNVHPRKLEIRFAQESTIFRGFYHAIQDKLDSVSLININNNISLGEQREYPKGEGFDSLNGEQREEGFKSLNGEQREYPKRDNFDKSPKYYIGSGTKFKSYSPYKNTSANPNQRQIKEAFNFSEKILNNNISLGEQREYPQGEGFDFLNGEQREEGFDSSNLSITPLGKIIGQMHNSYIIVETQNGMKILDQHALAERVIYERLVKNQSKQNIQGLLISESVNLSQIQFDIVKKYLDIFIQMGFEIETLSNNILLINAIPDFIKKENIKNIIEGVIDDIGEIGNTKSLTLEEIKNKIFAYTSCRSAIKFGHKLSLFEMNKLLNDSVLDYSSTCPHGRPVVYEINLMELQNKYER